MHMEDAAGSSMDFKKSIYVKSSVEMRCLQGLMHAYENLIYFRLLFLVLIVFYFIYLEWSTLMRPNPIISISIFYKVRTTKSQRLDFSYEVHILQR